MAAGAGYTDVYRLDRYRAQRRKAAFPSDREINAISVIQKPAAGGGATIKLDGKSVEV